MQNQCMLCKNETSTRCSVCKRYYCSTGCSKKDPQHKKICSTGCSKKDPQHKNICKPPTDMSVEKVVKTNAAFGIEVDPQQKFKVPNYKGEVYIAFPILDENNIPPNVFDVRSEDMKDFCQFLGSTPKALEEAGRRYWIKFKDYSMIMQSIGVEAQMKLLSMFHGQDIVNKVRNFDDNSAKKKRE